MSAEQQSNHNNNKVSSSLIEDQSPSSSLSSFGNNLFPSPSVLLNKAFSISSSIRNGFMIQAEEPKSLNLYGFFSAAVGLSKSAKAVAMQEVFTKQSIYPNIAHSDQVFEKSAGEDSYFQTSLAFGVGDGVGGWVKYNVDPSLISRSITTDLLKYFQEKESSMIEVLKNPSSPPSTNSSSSWWGKSSTTSFIIKDSPVEILSRVYYGIKASGSIRAGSTTFSMVMLSDMERGIAKSLNIGDSGFVIIRNGNIIYRSKPQQHRFNAPYQLTICPPERNGTCIQNEPKDGDLVEHQLSDGDIIVMGTDGLFDNLFDWQILQIINQGQAGVEPFSEILKKAATGDKESIQRVNQQLNNRAREIAKLARIVSISDSSFTFTPFSKAYTEETGRHISGGKKDDITVIVAALLKRKIFIDSFNKTTQ